MLIAYRRKLQRTIWKTLSQNIKNSNYSGELQSMIQFFLRPNSNMSPYSFCTVHILIRLKYSIIIMYLFLQRIHRTNLWNYLVVIILSGILSSSGYQRIYSTFVDINTNLSTDCVFKLKINACPNLHCSLVQMI